MAKGRFWVRYRLIHANGGISTMEEHVRADGEFEAARMVEREHTTSSTSVEVVFAKRDDL